MCHLSSSTLILSPIFHTLLKGFLQTLRRDSERMSKQAQTDVGQRAQTLVESRREKQNEKPNKSPSSGAGFLLSPPSATRLPTSHLLHHMSVVPVKHTFSGDSYSFQTALKDEHNVPRFWSKTIKPRPATWLSSYVLFHTRD